MRTHLPRRFLQRLPMLLTALTATLFACDEGPTEVERKLTKLVIVPASATLEVGKSMSFALQGLDQDGEPISTGAVQWASDDPTVAGIGAATTGQAPVSAAGPGTTTIRASAAGGVKATASVTVTPGAVDQVSVTPGSATIASGESRTFSAIARDAGGNEVPTSFAWSAAEGSIADVVGHGDGTVTVTGKASGTTEILATAGSRTGTAILTVEAGAAANVVIDPDSVSLASGESRALTATVRDAAGNMIGGADVDWSTSDDGVAAMADNGDGTATVTGGAVGSATVTASSGGVVDTAVVTVGAGSVSTIEIDGGQFLASGETRTFTATPRDAEGNEVPGVEVEWTSDEAEVALIEAAAAAPGAPGVSVTGRSVRITGGRADTATVVVSAGEALAVFSLIVSPGSLDAITVEPSSLDLRVGESDTVTATVRDAAGNVISDASIDWSSDAPTTASVVGSGTVAVVTGEAAGAVAIRATAGAAEGMVSVDVSEALVPMAWALVDAGGDLTTSTNLAEDEVQTQKTSAGLVEITFAGVALWGEHFFVHVSAVDPRPWNVPQAHCFVNDQRILLQRNLRVTVRCEKARPAPQQEHASPFRIVVIGDNVLAGSRAPGQRSAFSFNPSLTETQPTPPPFPWSWSSNPDESILMTYDHDAGEVAHAHGASLRLPFTYHVTQLGGSLNDACEAYDWKGNIVQVRCKHPDPSIGPRLVIPHAVLGFEKGRTGAPWGFALVAKEGEMFEFWSLASDGQVSASRYAPGSTGKYRITFGWQQSDVQPAVLVTPYHNDEWRQCAHNVSQLAPLTVDVVCWNEDGQWADTHFTVTYLK